MFLVREVLNTRPGKAKELVEKFKKVMPFMEKEGIQNARIMTDAVGDYWTVVMQFEVNDLGDFFKGLRTSGSEQEMADIMKGYLDLVKAPVDKTCEYMKTQEKTMVSPIRQMK